jgi:hypothetical protein
MAAIKHHQADTNAPLGRRAVASSPDTRETTFFCPACWEQVAEVTRVCPACGVDIPLYLSRTDYGAQLIATLRHPDAGRRLLAAWILSERREQRAVPALRMILLTEKRDVYMAKAAAAALARIGGVEAEEALHWARNCHPALVVRIAAARAFAG